MIDVVDSLALSIRANGGLYANLLAAGISCAARITTGREKTRVIVKRILLKCCYRPDKREKTTQTVLERAELLSQEWAV